MTNSLLKGLAAELNKTTTENGAVTNKSTHSALLDFFALGASLRSRPDEAVRLFQRALAEDKKYAVRVLFYIRDVREGQGERNIFRECFRTLNDKQIAELAPYVAEFGRWDDLIEFVDNKSVVDLIGKQIAKDSQSEKSVSLLAKWMPSTNTSSIQTRQLGNKWAKALGLSQKDYRKILAHFRSRIGILENTMRTKEWEKVEYKKLPSQAFRKHVKAFRRNDEERFEKFIEKVEKGEEKINAGTIYPYELLEQLDKSNEREISALWDNLPDYTDGKNAIVMADVSGSMGSCEGYWGTPGVLDFSNARPLATSVSLALYFAQRNKGQFKNYFLTFSGDPELVFIPENMSFGDCLRFISRANWEQNTNLIRAFEKILVTATNNGTPAEEMPSVLYIISDMEFDSTGNRNTNFDQIKQLYANAGYEFPTIVFWNVNGRNTQFPATDGDGNVSLVSGSSATTFKLAVEGKTPEETMFDLLNSERYAKIDITV